MTRSKQRAKGIKMQLEKFSVSFAVKMLKILDQMVLGARSTNAIFERVPTKWSSKFQ